MLMSSMQTRQYGFEIDAIYQLGQQTSHIRLQKRNSCAYYILRLISRLLSVFNKYCGQIILGCKILAEIGIAHMKMRFHSPLCIYPRNTIFIRYISVHIHQHTHTPPHKKNRTTISHGI